MKPRLHSALLTDEDLQIWVRIEACWNGDRHTKPWASGMTQDRRDAELMLAMRQWGFIRRITSDLTVYCLPDSLDEWWYWTRKGRVEGSMP